MNAKYLSILSVFSLTTQASAQVAHFDMSLSEGKITELVSAVQATVESQLPAFNVDGLEGKALRFDGYSNYVQATVPVSTFSEDALTATVLLAPETYPMMNADEAELSPTFGLICGNLDETAKTGIALELSSQGEIRFRFASANGFIYTIPSTQRLPLNKWSRITAVLDKTANLATLYMDAQIVGTTKMSRLGIKLGNNQFLIGKSSRHLTKWGANINTYCGLIDDIAIYNAAFSLDDVTRMAPSPTTAVPDFIYPESRYREGNAALWRPKYHAMPSGAWTNETHGMIWSGGRYHLFFQKNANGPYSGLATMRSEPISTTLTDIQGTVSLAPVSGRQIELQGEFVVGTTAFGFNFLKSDTQKASLTYSPTTNQLTLDLTSLKRYINDHIYGGKYQITLPEKPLQGEKLKIDLFLDGSIVDIFVADKWAFSVRLFPTDAAAIEAEAFADSHTQCTIRAWNIEPDQASTSTHQVAASESRHSGSQAYKLNGQICKDNQKGLVINRGKIYVRN